MEQQKIGRNGFVDAGLVVLAILLFFRTADVLTHFAPPYFNTLFGTDVSWLYAGLMAFWIEGMMVAFHFDKRTKYHGRAWATMWILVGISLLCQVFDGNIITNNIQNMGGPLKVVFQYGVPALPILVVVLLIWVGGMPEIGDTRGWLERLQDKGVLNYLPDKDALLHGRKHDAVQTNALDVTQLQPPAPTNTNGKSKTKTPTNP